MPKSRILEDTFEQLAELGKSTAKKTVKSVAQTFNPLSPFFNSETYSNSNGKSASEINEKDKSKNHTPLDFEKLQKNFQDKEKLKTEALRNRLFQMVRQSEERLLLEKKQKEMEKRRREELEKQEKKHKEEEEKRRQQESIIPLGKIRKTIFSPKKVAQRQHIETKASVGKH